MTVHALNDPGRTWPETNCYLDLWIGLLHLRGQDPRPLMGVAAGMAWEGDHFTFVKPGAGDLYDLAGIVLQEMALWDAMETQVATQLARGAVPLPEVDSIFLPDTPNHGVAHGKTTIGIVGQDRDARTLDYVHSGGLHRLSAEDYAGVLGLAPYQTVLFPYAELARLPAVAPDAEAQRRAARMVLRRAVRSRGPGNPVLAFEAALAGMLTGGLGRDVHLLCFNTARQMGAAFGLLADHLVWLGHDGAPAGRVSEQAKTVQFQLARAARRGRVDAGLAAGLRELASLWSDAARAVDGAAGLTGTPSGTSAQEAGGLQGLLDEGHGCGGGCAG